jgi:hypothetical protein
VRLFRDSTLPQATSTVENAGVLTADVNFTSSIMSVKRVTASIVISRQLLAQTGLLPSLDSVGGNPNAR